MYDAKMAIALLEVVANQERVVRLHNYTYGDSTGFLNRLMMLLGRRAVYADGATIKGSTILKIQYPEVLVGKHNGRRGLKTKTIVFVINFAINIIQFSSTAQKA
jgi:hypothetical protein